MSKVTEKAWEWINKKGNNKTKLARVLDITRPTLERRLFGESQWTWDEALTIASLTDTTPNELAGI